jgi:hypothetical protein
MTINAVELMRGARDKICHDTEGMSWTAEQAYLASHRAWLEALRKEEPNNSATSDRVLAGREIRGQIDRSGDQIREQFT